MAIAYVGKRKRQDDEENEGRNEKACVMSVEVVEKANKMQILGLSCRQITAFARNLVSPEQWSWCNEICR